MITPILTSLDVAIKSGGTNRVDKSKTAIQKLNLPGFIILPSYSTGGSSIAKAWFPDPSIHSEQVMILANSHGGYQYLNF
jgi:hypothetical protein